MKLDFSEKHAKKDSGRNRERRTKTSSRANKKLNASTALTLCTAAAHSQLLITVWDAAGAGRPSCEEGWEPLMVTKGTDLVKEMKIKIVPSSSQAKQSQGHIQCRKDPPGTEELGRAWLLLPVQHWETWTRDGRTQTGDARWLNTKCRRRSEVDKSFDDDA